MSTIISVENLSKSYRLSGMRNTTLREALAGAVKSRFRAGQGNCEKQILWALRDVSFQVEDGETLGILGHNGAGKSTLLKILSRITKPTGGTAEIKGRVGSLLEVGTGFHSELSGRENVYLSGAILGMTRREIQGKFDDIVAFAEIERFLETPVKHYSSGMFMRLAFSVAVHLKPEILLMDEVLAVGDVNFQHKCLNKMQEIKRSGRTILFVSHNMSAIARICTRSIALHKGQIVFAGETEKVIKEYLNSGGGVTAKREWTPENAPGSSIARLLAARVVSDAGETIDVIDIRRTFGIEIVYQVGEPNHILIPNLHFSNQDRQIVFVAQEIGGKWQREPRPVGVYRSVVWIPGNFMAEGGFQVQINVSTHIPQSLVHFEVMDAIGFEIVDPMTGDTARGDYVGAVPGAVRPFFEWTTEMETVIR